MQLKIAGKGPMIEYVSFNFDLIQASEMFGVHTAMKIKVGRDEFLNLYLAAQLKEDVKRERERKEQMRGESAQLAQELRHWEEKNRWSRILKSSKLLHQPNFPPPSPQTLNRAEIMSCLQ